MTNGLSRSRAVGTCTPPGNKSKSRAEERGLVGVWKTWAFEHMDRKRGAPTTVRVRLADNIVWVDFRTFPIPRRVLRCKER